jgi:stage V sporulation protein D (sporulation-specific penicillin-binding protein)
MGFGQEVSASALQVALLYAAVANGGFLLEPRLVYEIRDADGRIVERKGPRVMRRALREETSRTLAKILRDVVVEGTGKEAKIPWFPPAGKTGTAQITDPETGGYSSTDYMASFVGFAPWHEPRYLCIVVLDSPEGSIYGGTTAAPVFRAILEDLTAARGVFASAEAPPPGAPARRVRTVPDVRGLSPNEARMVVKAAGFVPVLEGRGMRIRETHPAPGSLEPEGGVVRLLPSQDSQSAEAVMPDLRGWPLRKALVVLSRMGTSWSVTGGGWVKDQTPAPGRSLSRGSHVTLKATHDASAAWASWRADWEGLSDASAWGTPPEGS